MVEPEKNLFCRFDGGTAQLREQKRLKALSELGLLEAETIPVFEEATQTAAHFLEARICILGFLDEDRLRVRSAVGLSRIGLMNHLAQERQLPRNEAFCTQVVESHQVLAISDTLSNSTFANSVLVQHYGIRAYLGAPLMDAAGNCLGAIAVMDRSPRTFTIRDIEFLELMARWSMSEFERNLLLKDREGSRVGGRSPDLVPSVEGTDVGLPVGGRETISQSPDRPIASSPHLPNSPLDPLSLNQIKIELLTQLTPELRTPLTSVLGMASVVIREVYGPLTRKQKEYLEIIQHSGRYLLSLVNEISELGALDDSIQELNLSSVDIEMLSQQVINTLEEAANRREQKISLSVEPGRSRIWVLDKDKVRQLLYHLVFSVIQASANGSVVRIHVSHKSDGLNLAVSVSHPWLGDGLREFDPKHSQLPLPVVSNYPEAAPYNIHQGRSEPPMLHIPDAQSLELRLSSSGTLAAPGSELPSNSFQRSGESLRLWLSYKLAQLHGGQISIQGTPESGYRYVVRLPELAAVEASL